MAVAVRVAAQAPSDIVMLDFAQAVPGPVNVAPASTGITGARVLEGSMAVVDHLGVRMLKASTRSAFVLAFTQVLPVDFTIEIDIVPKMCCQPEDVAVEGTASINQGPSSANILWRREDIRVVGGGAAFDRPVPEDLALTLPGVLTHIVLTFKGDELSVYTNGRLLYTLPNTKFVRGRVLRVFLGGQNDTDQAVYLSRLRVAAGVIPPATVAAVPVTLPSNPGITAGPVVPGQTGPLSAGQTAGISRAGGTLPTAAPVPSSSAPPAQPSGALTLPSRSVSLPGFVATGISLTTLPARALTLAGFVAIGVTTTAPAPAPTQPVTPVTLPARSLDLAGFAAMGAYVTLAPRSITLPGFSAGGALVQLAPRSITLSAFSASGAYASLAPRTIMLSGFSAAGPFVTLPARSIDLAAFSATGSSLWLAPRTLSLSGFSATGSFITLPPRTVALPGWTASGSPPP